MPSNLLSAMLPPNTSHSNEVLRHFQSVRGPLASAAGDLLPAFIPFPHLQPLLGRERRSELVLPNDRSGPDDVRRG